MIVGVPTEVKADEYRVGLRPVGSELLTRQGHGVLLQAGAGLGAGFTDQEYDAAGAQIVPTAEELWAKADLIVKVKEPQAAEVQLIRPEQVIFTYFHFASSKELTLGCLDHQCIAVVTRVTRPSIGGPPT